MNTSNFKVENIAETPGEKYGRVLWSQGLGYPLWLPKPQSGPTHFKDFGIMLGDVGFICFHGNKNRVPEGFVPMHNFHPNIDTEELGSLVITSNGAHVDVSKRTLESGDGELCYNIQSTLKDDAVLILPEGGVKEDLVNVDEILTYVSKHAANWYCIANGGPGGGEYIMNGSLHVATGQHRAAVWIAARCEAYRTPSGCGEFTIKAKTRQELDPSDSVIKTYYKWPLTFNGDVVKFWPNREDISRVVNQSLFLRTACVQLQDNAWRYMISTRSQRCIHLLSRLGWTRRDQVTVSAMFKMPTQLSHPSHLITSYLLRKTPKAKVAIAHHSNWRMLLENGEDLPDPDELEERLKRCFDIEMDKDLKAVFLRPRNQ